MDWDDPAARAALITRVGIAEYNRLHMEHMEASTVSRVAGHPIRTVNTRFGRLYAVGGTDKAFATLEQAEQYARDQPTTEEP